jgi:hypothetical protein
MTKEYTREEVIDTILSIRDQKGYFPDSRDYEAMFSEEEIAAMKRAVDPGSDARQALLGVRDYAVINHAVLVELRRRDGKPEEIRGEFKMWDKSPLSFSPKEQEMAADAAAMATLKR